MCTDCVCACQIGLLEPKYLPTGPQTERALKAVRFPTHVPSNKTAVGSETTGEGAVTRAIREAAVAKDA